MELLFQTQMYDYIITCSPVENKSVFPEHRKRETYGVFYRAVEIGKTLFHIVRCQKQNYLYVAQIVCGFGNQ